jgi:lycopene cyclase domain-containing protein
MTYWALNTIFLGVVVLVVAAALLLRRPPTWVSVGAAGVILILITAVFDNVMIGVGLVGYNKHLISGVFIGIAPLEDFAYTLAAVLLLPSLWALLGARRENA